MKVLDRIRQFGPNDWMCWGARIVILAWAAFWVWFNVGSGIHELQLRGPSSLGYHFAFALVVIIVACVAWFWDAAGAILLLLFAAVSAWRFYSPKWFGIWWPVPLLLLLPPLFASALTLSKRFRMRNS